ncbi:protein-export chaperone SecB [Moraxella caviae]|uniref:Protein-export protein SecB n=1 Tax=Moraxella caviae TaxID=34060 RepID=A0A1S9ZU30_9GAMM|nr:protein-export chaperone SecB [Moraxella caviae]OOR87012.1 protein-export chaperone SecB [Moraxella caviae]STZ10021.1 Protein-export protein secB [Moraxella caviae]VEW13212.1 Protein-export protein secB [Moraxella caviae]
MTDTAPQLGLERIYVKDISLEVPSADVFTKEWQPELDISVATASNDLDEDHKEVILSVSVNAKNAGSTAFIAEVQQAGIFLLRNIPEGDLPHLLQAYCPNVLFPYAREVISDIVTRGSFPQLLLAPVNFDQAFLQAQAELEAGEADSTDEKADEKEDKKDEKK